MTVGYVPSCLDGPRNPLPSAFPRLSYPFSRIANPFSAATTRQVIKSDFATVTFQEIEFQIPPRQKGEVTTVEGLLRTSAEKLGEAQDLRMERSPEVRHGDGGGDGEDERQRKNRGR